jgi:hypothetical protein
MFNISDISLSHQKNNEFSEIFRETVICNYSYQGFAALFIAEQKWLMFLNNLAVVMTGRDLAKGRKKIGNTIFDYSAVTVTSCRNLIPKK